MPRFDLTALLLLGTFAAGCGGASGLFATVPPPVELAAGGAAGKAGLIQVPDAGTYRGDLTVERVTMVQDAGASWRETAASPVESSGRAEATVGKDGTISLRSDADATDLFAGRLVAIPAQFGNRAQTHAILTAFDGNQERFDYNLQAGEPDVLRIVARTKVVRQGGAFAFDRYTFVLRP